ncbi:MAG TPA: SHOCT domain-containing protein [bacterium]|nr:SHOCT domain-containing protein [bacterium]
MKAGALSESPPPADPLAILKLRLAKGDITLEEYERLAAVLAGPGALSQREQGDTAN